MKCVLTIAGFDPSSGAGVTADLMVFAAHGLFGTSAITSLTVQSTLGVCSANAVDADHLRATLEHLHADLPPAGIKIGMLASAAAVDVVCGYIAQIRSSGSGGAVPIVLDPVIRSSSGRELLDTRGVQVMREHLLPLVDWLTPNIDELRTLADSPVHGAGDVAGAARRLQASVGHGSRLGVFVTGGHLDPPDDYVLRRDGGETWIRGVRIDTRATHGTGCALSSAFLSQLVIGRPPSIAAKLAKEYVAGAMRNAVPVGSGPGPMNLLWQMVNGQDAPGL